MFKILDALLNFSLIVFCLESTVVTVVILVAESVKKLDS